jgi:hypothetical protein
MNRDYRRVTLLPPAILCFAVAATTAQAATYAPTFFDGFEAPGFSSYWAVSGVGSAAPSNLSAFAGAQSAHLQVSSSFPWFVTMTHDYGTSLDGVISVYLERPGGSSSSAAALEISDSTGFLAGFQQTNTNSYVVRLHPGPGETDFSFTDPFPNAWHRLDFEVAPSGFTARFDGVIKASDATITSFSSLDLTNWGGPTGDAFFDNFSVTAPEPAGWWLCGPLLVLEALRRLRK